ncbi:unnamed protein product, partial [Mesorhabditis belari]|uniref:J domain-containing protein n=1 Tax=Mesorhabditis belari TaxID=2138241 RepID=A0AAF3EKS3_9BILA
MPDLSNVMLNLKPACNLSIICICIRSQSLYDVLGVSKSATQQQIKHAFYDKSKKLHPDGSHSSENERLSATKAFVELKHAYDTLRRPADRRAYDFGERIRERRRQGPSTGNFYGSSYYEEFEGRSGGFGNFGSSRMNEEDFRSASNDQWKWILQVSMIGFGFAILYNLGYVYHLYARERELAKLVDKDEIARSFLRQNGFEEIREDHGEIMNLAQILKDDVDEAWRRRCEEFKDKNRDEIREEYRWLRAVQDVDHNRRVRARRAAAQRDQDPGN